MAKDLHRTEAALLVAEGEVRRWVRLPMRLLLQRKGRTRRPRCPGSTTYTKSSTRSPKLLQIQGWLLHNSNAMNQHVSLDGLCYPLNNQGKYHQLPSRSTVLSHLRRVKLVCSFRV